MYVPRSTPPITVLAFFGPFICDAIGGIVTRFRAAIGVTAPKVCLRWIWSSCAFSSNHGRCGGRDEISWGGTFGSVCLPFLGFKAVRKHPACCVEVVFVPVPVLVADVGYESDGADGDPLSIAVMHLCSEARDKIPPHIVLGHQVKDG